MSTISAAHSIQFPSYSFNLFQNPSTSISTIPHAREVSVATRRVSPTLYPTPPPTAPFSAVAGPSALQKSNARQHFSTPHPPLPSGSRGGEDDGAKRESRVSKLTAQLVAQAQPCPCPWCCTGGCDAVLGSIDLLQRHVKKHLALHTPMYTGFQCLWERCIHEEVFTTIIELAEHIDTVHVPKLVIDKGIARNGRSTLPFRPTTTMPPRLPSTPVPTYVLTSHPIPGTASISNPDAPPTRRRSVDKVYPIMPLRDPTDYWPVNGEADVHNDNYWPSSSFFPRIMPLDRSELETKILNIQKNGEWKQELGITVRKRSVCVPIFDAGQAMRKRKVEAAEERANLIKRVKAIGDVKGKGKAVDEGEADARPRRSGNDNEGKRRSIAKITRASRNRAIRVTGRSVGIAAIEEMIAFEARGVEIGDLPEDFSFAKWILRNDIVVDDRRL